MFYAIFTVSLVPVYFIKYSISCVIVIIIYYIIINSPPLSDVDRLDNPGYLVDKGDGTSDMIQCSNVTYLFPWHWHVLQEFEHCVRHILQRPEGRGEGSIINALQVSFTAFDD